MGEQELYRKFAKYYDLIYDWMDYPGEAKFIDESIQLNQKSEGNELLDIACGTGGHLKYLKEKYEVLGVDLNQAMLEIAQKKLPEIDFISADMKNLDLQHKFDAIICLFSAINYHEDLKELENTLISFFNHLKSGGVLIFDLGFCIENWDEGRMLVDAVVEGELQLARISQSRLQHGIFNANFVFLVKENGKIDFEVDQHKIGVFSTGEVGNILKNIGMDYQIYNGYQHQPWNPEEDERPVFVCTKNGRE